MLMKFTLGGQWETWARWSDCSVTCGIGNQTRTRDCDNSRSSAGGANCNGAAFSVQNCTMPDCVVNVVSKCFYFVQCIYFMQV